MYKERQGTHTQNYWRSGWFTFLFAEETQGRDLRESAAAEEHDQDDALCVVLSIQICTIAAW